MSGKGSAPRPFSVPLDDYGDRFDAIFRKRDGLQNVHGYPQAHGEAHGPGQVQQDARQGVSTEVRG